MKSIGLKCSIKNKKYSAKDIMFFMIYSLYFILFPIYLWKSGLPQISDFILVLLIVTYTFINKFNFSAVRNIGFLKVGLIFVIWIVLVNSTWFLLFSTVRSFMISSLFYIFNFLVTVIVTNLYSDYKEKLLIVTYNAVTISVILEIGIFIINGGYSGWRMAGTFNNPNQLGYYGLLVVSFLLFVSEIINVQKKWFIIGVLTTLVLVAASLSKAAMLSYTGMIIFYLISKSQNTKFKKGIIVIFILTASIISIIYNTTTIIQENDLFDSVQRRISRIGLDKGDNPQARGYTRLTEYPQYWLFGAGEGEYSRFGYDSKEIHSTLGNIQVSYGLIGSVLFLSLLVSALKNNRFKNWYIIFFIMTYGLTHNGIRNSWLWILLALMSVTNTRQFNQNNSP